MISKNAHFLAAPSKGAEAKCKSRPAGGQYYVGGKQLPFPSKFLREQ